MSGPCLCGDPGCGRCFPGAQAGPPSFLVGPVLYCSRTCAGAARGPAAVKAGRNLRPEEFTTEAYGAMCPHCEEPYAEF